MTPAHTTANASGSGEIGSALVELALVLSVLIVVLVGAADFARAFYQAMELSAAARAGAQYGALNAANSANTSGMKSRAVSAAPNIPSFATSDVAAGRTCYCANTSASFGSAVSCTSTCSSGNHLVVIVTVTATKRFSMLTSITPFQRTYTVTRNASMRLQ